MQLRQKSPNKGNNGLISGLRNILANEGPAGLYGGIITKVSQSALTSAFLFLFKEQLYSVAIIILGVLRNLRRK